LISSNFEQTLRHLSRRYRAGIKTQTTKRDVEERTGAKGSLETLSFAKASRARAVIGRPFLRPTLPASRPFPMINVDRDGPRYHLLLAARFTRIDHGNEFYTESPPSPRASFVLRSADSRDDRDRLI